MLAIQQAKNEMSYVNVICQHYTDHNKNILQMYVTVGGVCHVELTAAHRLHFI